MDLALPVFSLGQGKDRGKRPEGTQCVHARFREKTDHISRMDTPWDLPVFSLGLFPWQGKDRNSSIVYFYYVGKRPHLREKTDFKHLLCSYEFWEKTAKENTTLQLPVFSLTEGKDRGKRPEGTQCVHARFREKTDQDTPLDLPVPRSREKTGIPIIATTHD